MKSQKLKCVYVLQVSLELEVLIKSFQEWQVFQEWSWINDSV